MTNKDIINIALQQSAYDCNCDPENFLQKNHKVIKSKMNPKSKIYLTNPPECNLVSYGSNIVAQVNERIIDIVTDYIHKYPMEHCFETPNLYALNDALAPCDLKVCFMAEYFLPDLHNLREYSCEYNIKLLHQKDFTYLYTDEWSNALCKERKEADILAVGAYDGGKLIGLAGCSADCEMMYQIGVDVLFEYRRKGIAVALTSRLTQEILSLSKVPFYCAAWSNIKSVRNAVKCGFYPAWIEMNAKKIGYVAHLNH